MDVQATSRQCAMLLHFTGPRVADIYDTLKADDDEFDTVKQKLTDYFAPQVNLHYETYVFRSAKQEEGETVNQFCTQLSTLANTCEFADLDRELHSQIIQHCSSQELRCCALRNPKMTLPQLLTLTRTLEASEFQAAGMAQGSQPAAVTLQPADAATVNAVSKCSTNQCKPWWVNRGKAKGKEPTHTQQLNKPAPQQSTKCFNCGGQWPHTGGRTACPAYGSTCTACSKPNHYAQHCMQTHSANRHKHRVSTLEDTETDTGSTNQLRLDDDCEAYVFNLGAVGDNASKYLTRLPNFKELT